MSQVLLLVLARLVLVLVLILVGLVLVLVLVLASPVLVNITDREWLQDTTATPERGATRHTYTTLQCRRLTTMRRQRRHRLQMWATRIHSVDIIAVFWIYDALLLTSYSIHTAHVTYTVSRAPHQSHNV